jgi:hypothetical protein
MKKRLFSFIIVFLVLVFAVPSAYASDADFYENTKKEIIYLADGSYIITTITEENARMSPYAAAQTKSGSKTSTVYSATGTSLYSITVHGTFSYNGSSATAKSSSYSHTEESPLWSFSSGSSSLSGATAMASGTFKSALTSKTLNVSLSCSASGTLS